jgi:hypothetical protein
MSRSTINKVRSKAGQVRSKAKARTSRRNGQLGGRPRNPEIARIMAERGCTRQMAWMVVRGLRK